MFWQLFGLLRQAKQRREAKREWRKQRTAAAVFLCTFGALPEVHFLHAIYHFKAQEVKNPTLQTVYDLELKWGRYGLRKTTAPSLCEIRTTPLLVRNSYQPMRGANSPLFCRLHFRSFLLYFFYVNSFLILVTSQSQALLCKDYKRGGNHLSEHMLCFTLSEIQSSLVFLFSLLFNFLEAKQPLRMFSRRMRG